MGKEKYVNIHFVKKMLHKNEINEHIVRREINSTNVVFLCLFVIGLLGMFIYFRYLEKQRNDKEVKEKEEIEELERKKKEEEEKKTRLNMIQASNLPSHQVRNAVLQKDNRDELENKMKHIIKK